MTETRWVHVTVEIRDEFEGWLEFAGRRILGAPFCESWPEKFTIAKVDCVMPIGKDRGTSCYSCEHGRTVVYEVTAEQWPPVGKYDDLLDGLWTPTIRSPQGQVWL